MIIYKIKQTCLACPSQWEGYFADLRPFYVRYRWGYLSICIGKKGGGIDSAIGGREIYGKKIGDEYDGVIDEVTVLKLIKEIPEENFSQRLIRDILCKFERNRLVRLFWYHFLGGKKIIAKQVEEVKKSLNK